MNLKHQMFVHLAIIQSWRSLKNVSIRVRNFREIVVIWREISQRPEIFSRILNTVLKRKNPKDNDDATKIKKLPYINFTLELTHSDNLSWRKFLNVVQLYMFIQKQ
jgi:putative cell wall-binding protein